MMKVNFVITMLLLVSGLTVNGGDDKQIFDRNDFYAAFSSDKLEVVNAALEAVLRSTMSNKEGFEGALLMKKAGLVPNLGSKLNLFKSGHKKLDKAIVNENKNAELRFLRLVIQEQAPKILNYWDQIDEDSLLILSSYNSLPPVVKKAVFDYSRKSKVLKPAFS